MREMIVRELTDVLVTLRKMCRAKINAVRSECDGDF